jgi:hyperosmotically inducible protein
MKLIQLRKTLFATAMAAVIGATGAAYAQNTTSTDPQSSATVGDAITDTAITTKIKAKLIADNRTKTVKIGVETNNGVVTLSGKARSTRAKAAAETIASGVDGVKSVTNDITIGVKTTSVVTKTEDAADATGQAVSDTWITTKVKTSLLVDKQIKDGDVSVDTTDGVVTLTGTVPSTLQKTRAIHRIMKIKGVKNVVAGDLKIASAS